MAAKKITRKTSKKQKNEMLQTDGKDWSEEQKTKVVNPRTLDDIVGNQIKKYSFSSAVAYEESVKNLNLIDLQKECVRVGLMPLQNREIMVARLMDQFNLYLGGQRARNTKAVRLPCPKNVQDILSRGANRLK